jgi:flagellar hook-length control protein FliK
VQASTVPLAANAPVSGSSSHEKVSAASKVPTRQTAASALASTAASASQLTASSTAEQPSAPSGIGAQADANQQQAQNREKLALEITAGLHSPLGDALPTPAPNSTTVLADASAIPPGAQPANASTSSDSVKPANSDSGSSSASQFGSGDSNSQNPNASSNLNGSSLSVANGSGAFAIASSDFSRHVATPEAMLSPQTSADTTSTAAAQRPTGTALLTAQQPALPSSLPASLNDVVQASRLYQRVGGAEMHIAMDTDLLGSIDLRAVVHQSGLTATIGVQHADVQALLSSELPGLQHALSQKNLHVEQISIFGSAVGSQSNQGGSQSQQQKQTPAFAPQATAAWPGSASGPDGALATVSDSVAAGGGTGRLSVHA